ncbi:hypothetical protein D3C73_1234470 [compost metagenome]
MRRVLEPQRICLVRDGRIIVSGLKSEHISRGELMEQLRLKGVGNLASVKRAYLESTGEFSVIKVGEDIPSAHSTLEEKQDRDPC